MFAFAVFAGKEDFEVFDLYTIVTPGPFAFLFDEADVFREVVFLVTLMPKFTFYFHKKLQACVLRIRISFYFLNLTRLMFG